MKNRVLILLFILFLMSTMPVPASDTDHCYLENRARARETETVDFLTIGGRSNLHWYKGKAFRRLKIASESSDGIISHTDKNGNLKTYTYDDLHRLETIKQDNLTVKDFDYDNVGNILSVKDALENSIAYEYNEMDLRTAINYGQDTRTGEEIRETFAYDHLGNMVEHLNADNKLTEYEHNPRNELTRQIVRSDTTTRDQLNDIETTFAYDNNGNRTSVINPLGNATTYGFDRMNRLKQVTLPADSSGQSLVTSYSFDKRGNLIEQNFGGTITGFGYNPRNERTSMTATGRITQYLFDNNGNLDLVTRPNGDIVDYDYNGLNRLTTETNTPSGTPQGKYSSLITYDHDGNGNQISVTNQFSDASIQSTITDYDTFDRPVSIDINGRKISKTYFDNGNLASEKDPTGRTMSYLYDGQNRMTQAMTPEGLTKYDHTPGGRLDTVTKPNGSKTSYFYDFADRVSSINTVDRSGLQVSNFGYDYDKNSNRTLQSVGFQNETPTETMFGYDTQDRLETSTRGTKITTFGYDTQGNRTSLEVKEDNTTTDHTIYNYDQHKQLVSTQNTVNPATNQIFQYDPNGNMTNRTQGAITEQWEYSPRNQPIGYYRNNEPNPIESYTYDELGMRNAKINHQDNQTTNYLHDGRRIIQESDAHGHPQRNYRYGNGLIGYIANGLPKYTHTDPLGSITAVTGADGSLLESRTYEPFGSSDVVESESNTLPNVNLFYEGTPDPILIGDIFDSPIPFTQTVEIQSPVDPDMVEGDIWSPDIYLTIGDDPDPVRIPVAPVPIIMVTDLSPPFVTMTVDEKYLDPEGSITQLNYSIVIDLGYPVVEEQNNAVLTIDLPKNLTIMGSTPQLTDNIDNHITWELGDLVEQNTTVTFQVDINFTDNKNVLIMPHAELTSDEHLDPVFSNQTPTAIMNEGIAFFAEAYNYGTTTPTAYAKLNDPTYSTDFFCTLIYQGEQSQNVRSFIAKEFDSSTDHAYFGARYLDSIIGRFTSVDPLLGNRYEPRSLHKYNYAFNNPLRYIDIYGLEVFYEGPYSLLLSEVVKYLTDASQTINRTITAYSGKGENDPDLIFNTTDQVFIDVKGEFVPWEKEAGKVPPGMQIVEGLHEPTITAFRELNESKTGLTDKINCSLARVVRVKITVPTHVFVVKNKNKLKKDKVAGVLIHEIGHADDVFNNPCKWAQEIYNQKNLGIPVEEQHSKRDVEMRNIPYIKQTYNEVKEYNKKLKKSNKNLSKESRIEIIKPTLELP